MPPSVAARRCHSRSACEWRRPSLYCRCSMARFAARIDDERADDDDDDVDAVASNQRDELARIPPRLADAEARQRERDAGQRRNAVGEQRQRANQLLRARVHGRAVLGADDVEPAQQPATPWRGRGARRRPRGRTSARRRRWSCSGRRASEPLNLEVVGVGVASRSGLMLTNTTAAPAPRARAPRAARPISVPADPRVSPMSSADGHHAPVQGEPARRVVAIGGRENRRARAERRQPPRRAAAARDGHDGLGVAAVGERDRRLAERLRMVVARVVSSAQRIDASRGGLDSASRMIASSVCTARAGNAPTAVSPASMIASTPSSTALAASLTSARVGRASCVIDSSTCVATMTGMPRRRALRDDLLLRPRHALERHLESEIAARHHDRVARRQDLVEMFERLRPFELGDQRNVGAACSIISCRACRRSAARLHEAERDHIDAERQAERQVVDVLRRDRRRRQRHARRVDALVLAELSAFDDRGLDLGAVGRVDAQLDEPVGERAGGRRAARCARAPRTSSRCGPGPPTKSPVAMRSVSPALQARAVGRLRACRFGSSVRRDPEGPRPRVRPARPPRGRGRSVAPATRACRARSSDGRCRCRRQSARRASCRNRSRDRRVEMIFVWRM